MGWHRSRPGRACLRRDARLPRWGLAVGRVDNRTIANVDDGRLHGLFLDDKTRLGWMAGVGVEHMFAPHWTVRGEWRYVDLGTYTARCVNGNGVCAGAQANFSNSLMLGLVGVAYKFHCHERQWPGKPGHCTYRYGYPRQPFTRTGPVPCGRSPSLMMPRRLATSV